MIRLEKGVLKIMVTTLAILIILGNSFGYANSSFSDVPANHWAITYINKMNSTGIITGMSDGTYKPNLDVPVSQAIVMMVRLIEAPTSDLQRAVSIYGDLLTEVGVEGWSREQMAYGLLKGIITENELRSSYINGKVRTANKLEICRYLTRALGLEDEAKSKEIIVLSFNDNIMIPDEDIPYISMMINIGVIDQYGDVLGNFNPQASMNRAMMAKVLSVAYDYRQDIKKKELAKANKDVTGTIEDIKFGTTPKLVVKDSTNNLHEHNLSDAVKITKGKDKVSVLDLKIGDHVNIKVVDNLIINISLLNGNTVPTEEDVEGVLKSIVITNKVEINIKDKAGVERTYRLAPHNVTIIDQKTKGILDLRAGYSVKLKIINGEVVVIFAESKETSSTDRYTGIVEYVDVDLNAFILRSEGKTPMRIDTTATTTYINTVDDDSSFKAIKVDKKITVIGKVVNGRFVAETIVITE